MKINEKLKQASLEAELAELQNINRENDWAPSKAFEGKMREVIDKKRVPVIRYIAIIAAAALTFTVMLAFLIPMLRNSEQTEVSGGVTDENSGILDAVDLPAKPEYLPEGYYMNSCTVWADGSLQIEYIDGENQIIFQSYPASSVDLSVFEEVVSNVDINGNTGFAANNFNGFVNNNIAWADGNYSYVITNSEGVNLEELVRIALSVEREESE